MDQGASAAQVSYGFEALTGDDVLAEEMTILLSEDYPVPDLNTISHQYILFTLLFDKNGTMILSAVSLQRRMLMKPHLTYV